MINFIQKNHLVMSQSYSWHSNDHVNKKLLEYMLLSKWLHKFCCDVRICNNYLIDSDHRFLVGRCNLRKIYRPKMKKGKRRKKPDLKSLSLEKVNREFCESLDEMVRLIKSSEMITDKAILLSSTLNECASTHFHR